MILNDIFQNVVFLLLSGTEKYNCLILIHLVNFNRLSIESLKFSIGQPEWVFIFFFFLLVYHTGKISHTVFFANLRVEKIAILHIKYDVACGLLVFTLYCNNDVPFHSIVILTRIFLRLSRNFLILWVRGKHF